MTKLLSAGFVLCSLTLASGQLLASSSFDSNVEFFKSVKACSNFLQVLNDGEARRVVDTGEHCIVAVKKQNEDLLRCHLKKEMAERFASDALKEHDLGIDVNVDLEAAFASNEICERAAASIWSNS